VYHHPMQDSKGIIKALHLFDLHGMANAYKHSQTILVHSTGFKFIVFGVDDEIANRRTKKLLDKVEPVRLEREKQGNPFNFDDYLRICQIGLLHSFVGSSNTYSDSNNLEEIIKKERTILEEGGVKYETPKSNAKTNIKAKDKKLSDLIFPPMTPEINSNILQVFEDYPSFFVEFTEGVPTINSPGMVEFLFAKLGSVDPNGPNGWFLELFDSEGNLKP